MDESGEFLSSQFAAVAVIDSVNELHQLLQASLDPRFSDFLALPPGTLSDDETVIVGRAGHLFVNDGTNQWRKQLSGEAVIDSDVEVATHAFLNDTHSRLSAMGVGFYFVVYPEKDLIYSEFTPNVDKQLNPHRAIHRMQTDQVRPIYPAAAMAKARMTCEMFHRRNSHVNFFGGLIASNLVISHMGLEPLSFADIQTDIVNWPDDLSIKWVEGLVSFRRRVKPVFHRETIHMPAGGGHVGTRVTTRNERASGTARILIFGDSYSWNPDAGLLAFLSLRASEVLFVWQKLVDWSLIEEFRPTHVVLESAERFLIRGLSK